MKLIIRLTGLIICLVQIVLGDIEYTNLDFGAFREDNSQAEIKIQDQKSQICQSNSEQLWKFLKDRIDTNNDSIIDPAELHAYLSSRVKKMHHDELNQQINRLDTNHSGLIEFKVYIRDAFDNLYDDEILEKTSSQLSQMTPRERSQEDDEFKELKDLYNMEKEKWYFVSSNSDFLTHEQFYQFVFAEEFQVVRDFEVSRAFANVDSNKDGFISVDEFVEHIRDYDQTMINIKKKKFEKSLDSNGDNQLDVTEFKSWFLPSFDQILGEEEDYIMRSCDSKSESVSDKKLDKTEVAKCCMSLLNSQITNYGIDLTSATNEQPSTKSSNSLNDEL